jgi:aminomethyltransferase
MERKTPLYETHVAEGGKMVPFAGHLLPIQYAGIAAEHMAVREKAGLFDVSHMGEIEISGSDSAAALNRLISNDVAGLAPGRVRYSPMLNDSGGVIDDLLVYCMDPGRFILVVNAANREKDAARVRECLFGDAKMADLSDGFAQIAVQGPQSAGIIAKLAAEKDIPKKYYSFVENASVGGARCILSRTGYTGSFGYEIYCDAADAAALWEKLRGAGEEFGLVPCGLGARDTLRLEACMPLYGHEMDDSISPLETGLDFAVKMDKPDFFGKAGLLERGEPKIARVGLKATGRGIVREGGDVFAGTGEKVGRTTSGTHLPYMNAPYAMALVGKKHSQVGEKLSVEMRGRMIETEVVPMPFYKP